MAEYSGAFIAFSQAADVPNYVEAIRSRPSPQRPVSGVLGAELHGTVFLGHQPIDIYGEPKPGKRLFSFFDDYYNKVYALPHRIDFGSISSEINRQVVFWNAHFFNTDMTSAEPFNLSGVEMLDVFVPKTFKPLATFKYIVQALPEGAASLDGLYSMQFHHEADFGQELVLLPITGSRARISPMKPNWRDSFNVAYEFRTEIITSRAGKEQRRALRSSPRKRVEFTATASRAALRSINENFAFWHSRPILLPERPRAAFSDLPLLPGETEFHLAGPAPSWAISGAPVMLVHGEIEEPRTIASVAGQWISFDGPGSYEFPAGSRMVFVLTGYFPEEVSSKRFTSTVGEVAVVFIQTPTSEIAVPVSPPALVFNGREVFLTRPNWGGDASVTYSRPIDEVDFGRGKTGRMSTIEFETIIRKFEYIGRDFATSDAAREFFYRMRGQHGEFYMPTWENDLVPATTSPALTNYLRTEGYSIYDNYEGDTVHLAVCVIPHVGEPILRRVEVVYRIDDDLGQHSAIQIEGVWPIDISEKTVKQICWMPVWRLASDTFTLEWQTNTVAQFAFTMQTVEDLA